MKNNSKKWNMCIKKVDLRKESAFVIAAGLGQRAYKCLFCNFWHLTTKTK